MEKQSKPKNNNHHHHNVLKFLKAASSINFNNPPFSPSRDANNNNNNKQQPFSDYKVPNYQGNHRGFSGPIFLPRVPREVRGQFKSGEAAEEPTSPKISCIGQIKHKKCGGKKATTAAVPKPAAKEKKQSKKSAAKEHKNPKPQAGSPGIWKIFGSGSFKLGPSSAPGRKRRSNSTSAAENLFISDDEGGERAATGQPLPDRAPGLGQMMRFASGHRDGFGDFDWTARIAPDHHQFSGREYDSDDDACGYSDDEMGAKEGMIPFSAPIRVDVEGMRLRPRKEVNLWKRRTMEPPRPLQLVGSGSFH